MRKNFSDFIYNLKMYFKYITKVGFKELFIDVIILIALAIISSFVYIPVGLVSELVRNLLSVMITFKGTFAEIYIWVFNVLSALAAIALFIYLFNNRYDFKNGKVVPVEGSYTLERKEKKVEEPKENKSKEVQEKEVDLDLPKEKEEK